MILTLIIGFLVGLPFIDRSFERHPRQRMWVIACTSVGITAIATLTAIALRDTPPDKNPDVWSPIAIAGQDIAERKSCGKCHGPDSVAPDLARGHVSHDNAWIRNHLSDPEAMAPGARPIPFDAPTKSDIVAVIAYQRMVRAGAPVLHASAEERKVSILYATHCASCHIMDGDGIADGPDLSRAGRERDAKWIAEKIVDPLVADPKARMPSLKEQMSPEDVQMMATFLASRK
jgi:mono/diheme cytochrome c family protein